MMAPFCPAVVKVGGSLFDLPDLGGAAKLRKLDVPVRTLITFEGH